MEDCVTSAHLSRISIFLVLIATLSVTSGCGTIVRGTTQEIAIDSSPQGAIIQASNGMGGTTPMSIKADRDTALTVKISKDGYKDHSTILTPHVSGGGAAGLAGNILAGGIIGAAVDAGSGAMYDLSPDRVFTVLEKDEHVFENAEKVERVARKSRRSDHDIDYRTERPERIIEYRTEYVVVPENDPRLKKPVTYQSNSQNLQYVPAIKTKPEPQNIPAAFKDY